MPRFFVEKITHPAVLSPEESRHALRALRLAPGQSSPDVLPRAGAMTWPRAMPVEACAAVARFLVAHTACRTVVDPFCGLGTMLAVANAYGLDAVGVEQSPKRAERARGLIVEVDGG